MTFLQNEDPSNIIPNIVSIFSNKWEILCVMVAWSLINFFLTVYIDHMIINKYKHADGRESILRPNQLNLPIDEDLSEYIAKERNLNPILKNLDLNNLSKTFPNNFTAL